MSGEEARGRIGLEYVVAAYPDFPRPVHKRRRSGALEVFRIPVFTLFGLDDDNVRENTEALLAAGVPSDCVKVFPGAGHSFLSDDSSMRNGLAWIPNVRRQKLGPNPSATNLAFDDMRRFVQKFARCRAGLIYAGGSLKRDAICRSVTASRVLLHGSD